MFGCRGAMLFAAICTRCPLGCGEAFRRGCHQNLLGLSKKMMPSPRVPLSPHRQVSENGGPCLRALICGTVSTFKLKDSHSRWMTQTVHQPRKGHGVHDKVYQFVPVRCGCISDKVHNFVYSIGVGSAPVKNTAAQRFLPATCPLRYHVNPHSTDRECSIQHALAERTSRKSVLPCLGPSESYFLGLILGAR